MSRIGDVSILGEFRVELKPGYAPLQKEAKARMRIRVCTYRGESSHRNAAEKKNKIVSRWLVNL